MRTGGFLWGNHRIRLGISITELSRRTGINVGMLSHMENGRMIPTAGEWDRVHAALRDAEGGQATAASSTGVDPG
jgi:predicted transcriptional regulator